LGLFSCRHKFFRCRLSRALPGPLARSDPPEYCTDEKITIAPAPLSSKHHPARPQRILAPQPVLVHGAPVSSFIFQLFSPFAGFFFSKFPPPCGQICRQLRNIKLSFFPCAAWILRSASDDYPQLPPTRFALIGLIDLVPLFFCLNHCWSNADITPTTC